MGSCCQRADPDGRPVTQCLHAFPGMQAVTWFDVHAVASEGSPLPLPRLVRAAGSLPTFHRINQSGKWTASPCRHFHSSWQVGWPSVWLLEGKAGRQVGGRERGSRACLIQSCSRCPLAACPHDFPAGKKYRIGNGNNFGGGLIQLALSVVPGYVWLPHQADEERQGLTPNVMALVCLE